MADGGIWGLGYVGGFIPQTPWKKLAVALKPWLKPIYLTKSGQLHGDLQGQLLGFLSKERGVMGPYRISWDIGLAERAGFEPAIP